MSDEHEGIACDVCDDYNFTGARFACLVCDNYDLCEQCYELRCFCHDHRPYHPMQQILSEAKLFQRLEQSDSEQVYTFCCPYCGDDDFTVGDLIEHCRFFHREGAFPVRCPVCLVYRRTSVPFVKDALHKHALIRHKEYCSSPVSAEGFSSGSQQPRTQECTICLESILEYEDSKRLRCSHQFHSSCIVTWFRNSTSCPVCRDDVRQ